MNLKSKSNTKTNKYELMLEVTPEEFDNAVNAVFKKESQKMNIPGFRRGKAPRKYIEKYYGEEVFYDAALEHIYRKMVSEAVEQSELEVVSVSNVNIEEIGKEIGVLCKVTVVTKPEVEISDYKGISVNKEVVSVSDEEIEAEIDRVRDRNSRMVDVTDRPAENDDAVIIDFDGSIDGVPFDGGKAENHELTLGSGQFIPGFEEQVVGHSVEDEFDVNVKFPEDYQAEELQGKDAVFKVKLHEIKKKELPEVDDEFVKDVSEFDTLDEYKADLEKHLLEHKEEHAKTDMENELIEAVIQRVQAEIPEEMIHNEVDEIINNLGQRLQQQGMDLDTYLKYTGMTMDNLHAQYHNQAEMQVKVRLGLEKISALENITATDEEVDAEIEKLAEAYNMPVENIKAMVSSDMISADIVNRKTMDYLRESAKVTEMTTEEIKKMREKKEAARQEKEKAEAESEEIRVKVKPDEDEESSDETAE